MEVRDCYLFEPQGWNPSDHVDGIQVGGGRNVTIVNNTVLITPYGGTDGDTDYVSNSALGLWAELGNVTGTVLVDHNYLAGGGRIMYLEQKSPYAWQGPVTVSDNVFDREFTKHGGIWGVLYPDGLPDNLAWTGNTWEDGTAALRRRNRRPTERWPIQPGCHTLTVATTAKPLLLSGEGCGDYFAEQDEAAVGLWVRPPDRRRPRI